MKNHILTSIMEYTIGIEDEVDKKRNIMKNVKLNEDVIPCKKGIDNRRRIKSEI